MLLKWDDICYFLTKISSGKAALTELNHISVGKRVVTEGSMDSNRDPTQIKSLRVPELQMAEPNTNDRKSMPGRFP